MDGQNRVTVSISDMKASNDPSDYLITHSLGSCVGIVAYSPGTKAGALLHLQLPDSKGHEKRSAQNPFMFADTGIPLTLERMMRMRASKNGLQVSLFGGAAMLNDNEVFKIGVKNARAAKKILWQFGIPIHIEDLGGKISRTVGISIATGQITLRKNGQTHLL